MTNKEILVPTVDQIAERKVPVQGHDLDEVHGDDPGGVHIVDARVIGEVKDEDDFPGLVDKYLKKNPELVEAAKASEEDVVARMDGKMKVVMFVASGAATIASLAIAAIVIHKHRERSTDE